jgi:hypothetical protein
MDVSQAVAGTCLVLLPLNSLVSVLSAFTHERTHAKVAHTHRQSVVPHVSPLACHRSAEPCCSCTAAVPHTRKQRVTCYMRHVRGPGMFAAHAYTPTYPSCPGLCCCCCWFTGIG